MLLAACTVDQEAGSAEFDESSDTTEPLIQAPARGIAIREIEVNQGTRVVIGENGDWVDPEQRALGLIASRDSLLRVHYTVDPGWIPRDIEARLLLSHADGTSETLSVAQHVEGDSTPDSLEGGFWFALTAQQAAPQTEYRVELWELRETLEELPELAWANPAAGPQPIGFEAVALEMKVVIVPIHYVPDDTTPELDDEVLAEFVDGLYEQNPTNRVLLDVREPVDFAEPLGDIAELLPLLSQLKVADQADPNTYYHALIDVGAPMFGGLRGIGNIVGPGEDEGPMRVAATVFWSANPSLAAETFTHEIGHNQGLQHVSCPNVEADGLEAGYPHPNGLIGNWGAGVRRLDVFGPEQAYDYMSYCGPSWVSDWTWIQTRERIATLSAWDLEADVRSSEGSILIGALQADGSAQWWTAPGTIDPARASRSDRVSFVSDEGEVVEQWAKVDTLSDGTTKWVEVELPMPFDRIAAIHHQRGSITVEVPLEAVVTRLDVEPWTPRLRAR
jgi:hypothetical protein